jgi:hypothetical protein
MKIVGKLAIIVVVVFLALQAVRPHIPSNPNTVQMQAPPEVQHVLEKDCYSCHSNQRRLSWFDHIVPGYWLVRHDILTARSHLNFSTLGAKPAAVQKATLYEAVNMIQLGAMPLPRFLRLHPDARVTPAELTTLKTYLAPWSSPPNPPASSSSNIEVTRISLASVRPEWTGFPFDPAFESWKPISTTDRGDNNTFRFVLGNGIAVKAAQSGNISPWPDGARFAKVAWQQELGSDGLVHPGKFVQVELMLKDAKKYKDTDGWGWGRWRGLNLEPYGKDARFVKECTSCHLPVRGNDYVYTLPFSDARVKGVEVVNNSAAALPASLPYQPLGWNAITLYVDARTHTTATLYGNDAAIQAAQALRVSGVGASSIPTYPAGSVLALVTWAQRDDPHWFGARIPAVPQSVEFVQVADAGHPNNYRRFNGTGLVENYPAPAFATQRINFLLTLTPVQLP